MVARPVSYVAGQQILCPSVTTGHSLCNVFDVVSSTFRVDHHMMINSTRLLYLNVSVVVVTFVIVIRFLIVNCILSTISGCQPM